MVNPSPAVPSLVIIPDRSLGDYQAIYAIATAYAHAGLLVSVHSKETRRPEYVFPAVVCSSFAIELYLKFFSVLCSMSVAKTALGYKRGHSLEELWKAISPDYQAIIAGMFRNPTEIPYMNGTEMRVGLFYDSLCQLGHSPFIKWRYPYELADTAFLSHAAVNEVLDALGFAAQHVMRNLRNDDS